MTASTRSLVALASAAALAACALAASAFLGERSSGSPPATESGDAPASALAPAAPRESSAAALDELEVDAERGARSAAPVDPRALELPRPASERGGDTELEAAGTRAPTNAIEGEVVDERGLPIERFDLELVRRVAPRSPFVLDETRNAPVEARHSLSGSNGRFVATGLAAGDWTLVARAPGHADSRLFELSPRVEPARLRIVLPRLASARGVVLDADGAPLPRARVAALREGDDPERALRDGATCDGSGRFELELAPAARAWLVADGAGLARSELVAIDAAPGARSDSLVLRLRRSASLEVELRDREGRLEAGFDVHLVRDDGGVEREVSGSEGLARIVELPPGGYEVVAASRTGTFRASAPVELRAGEHRRVLVGGPPVRPIRVTGRVHRGGLPVAGSISLARAARAVSSVLDADGRFELVVEGPGEYERHVAVEGGRAGHYARVVVPDREELRLDVELAGASLGGTLLDADGSPAAELGIELFVDPEVADLSGAGAHAAARTDERGRFGFADLPAGRYALRFPVGAPADSPRAVETRRGIELAEGERRDDLELRARRPAALEGRVRDSLLRPARDARVVAVGEDGRPLPGGEARSAVDGSFRLEGLAPGALRLVAFGAGEVSEVAGPIALAAGESRAVELDLQPGGSVVLRVLEADGRPVGAALRAIGAGGVDFAALAPPAERPAGEPGAAPALALGPLPPGPYTLRAINHARVAAERRVQVVAGGEAAVELLLGR